MTQEKPAWRILANPTRQKIITLLGEETRTTGALCEEFELSRYAVMQHLRVLEKTGVVSAEKRGRFRINRLNHQRLHELQERVDLAPVKRKPVDDALISAEFQYAADVSTVFSALTNSVDKWWPVSAEGDSSGVYLEPRIGGRLYEPFDDTGNGVLLATVDHFKKDALLGLMGSMGTDNAISLIRIRLFANGKAVADSNGKERTELKLQHRFVGIVDNRTREAFQQSWHLLLGSRLKRYIETA